VISVVMPAHNEEGYLEPAVHTVVSGLSSRALDYEVIIVQNGSLDSTSAEAARLAHRLDRVAALDRADADYGLALREGFLHATGDVVVNFDVDLVDLDFLDRALAVLADERVAIVVGSKRDPESEDRRGPARRLVTNTFALVLRYGFGLQASDTHGLKAMRRTLVHPLVEASRFGKDIFDTEMILRAERSGLTVEEIPVEITDSRPPRTPIARRIPRTLVGLARLWWVLNRPGRVSEEGQRT
jgi:glycosyltransferase involved in cell wall biosynthesis